MRTNLRSLALLFWLLCVGVPAALAQQCNILYVVPDYAAPAGEPCTRQNPCRINEAVTFVSPSTTNIYLATGLYVLSSEFPLVNGVTFEGGYEPAKEWAKSNEFRTLIIRDTNNAQTNPNRVVGISGVNLSNFRISDITLSVADADSMKRSMSVYGIYLSGCSNYVINRVTVRSGNAGDGAAGSTGTNGASGVDGAIGQPGEDDGGCCTAGGAGGASWSLAFPPGSRGGNGGTGGARGTCSGAFNCLVNNPNGRGFPGTVGQTGGGGVVAGAGGTLGPANTRCVSTGNDNANGEYNGGKGGRGQNGANGSAGNDGIASHTGGFFVPGSGQNGQDGQNGGGGGGGGGGGSQGGLLCPGSNNNGSGAGGGGGGEGGQAGTGGTGGGGGGGSFAIYASANGPGAVIRDAQYLPGAPGRGALGGLGGYGGRGGEGGIGGNWGLGGQTSIGEDIGKGGFGGAGGDGGTGGRGGRGADGVSIGLFQSGTAITIQNLQSPDEPNVTVRTTNCTDANTRFIVDAAGTILWFFGAGANPSTASGDSVVTQYTTTGRKTITVSVNGQPYTLSEYIDIRGVGVGLNPQIVVSNDTICLGQIPTFSSSVAADRYYWYFPNDTIIGTQQTINTIGFPAVGSYTVKLRTENDCCGISDPVTVQVVVRPNPAPSVTISSNSPTFCQGQCSDFTSSSINIGVAPIYVWRINGVPISPAVNSPVLNCPTLSNGDVVDLGIVVFSECSNGDTVFSNTISILVNQRPQLVTVSGGKCLVNQGVYRPGQLIDFTASATGGNGPYQYYWDFGTGAPGGVTQSAGPSTATTLFTQPGRYIVKVEAADANGCLTQACYDTVNIAFFPVARFRANPEIGCAPLTVNFNNQSQFAVSYRWDFGDGAVSTDVSPSHIYTATGNYTVTLLAIGTNANDTAVVTFQVVVTPKPVADIVVFPNPVTTTIDSVLFASSTLGATQWEWNFGDPASGANNTSNLSNPVHYYAAEGTYTVTLMVENAFGCRDTIVKTDFITKEVQTVSVGEYFADHNFGVVNLYPNPFSEYMVLEVQVPSVGRLTADLVDVTGKHITNIADQQAVDGINRIEWRNVNSLASGVYFVRIGFEGRSFLYKVVHN